MYNTLRNFSPIIIPEFQKMSLEQLAEVYTEELNPCVLASAFSKTFKLIISISQKFFGFTSEDIASFALETLDKCLQTYISGTAIFSTYFTTIFRNKLREESEKLNTDKRKACLYSSSLENLMEAGFDVSSCDKLNEKDFLLEELERAGLDSRELKYCGLLLDGYTNKEISEQFNTSIMTLSNLRKKLRTKLALTPLDFA